MRCLLLAIGVAIACSASFARAEGPKRPNVVLILADDLGYTDVACNGGGYYQTPHIDALAASGLRMTDGHTCGPNCQPTRAALMSGQYGPRTGVYTVGGIDRFAWETRPLHPVENVTKLPLEVRTVADMMKSAGYHTAMFGKWHLGEGEKYHPAERGFDEAIVSNGRHVDFETNPKQDVPEDAYLADWLTDRAVDFIARHKDDPFFLYLPHFGVHSPYQAKEEWIAKAKTWTPTEGHNDPVYAAMIASVDESVGRIVATLKELGLSENTLVIFTSDNGGVGGYKREGIGAGNGKGGVTDNAPLRGGKGMLYEGGHRVAYIFNRPGTIAPGQTSDLPILSVDLFPTLMELAGGTAPAGQTLDGASYAGLISRPGASKSIPAKDRAIFWHFPGYLGSSGNTWRTTPVSVIRQGDWKLMEFFEDGHLELYNLAEDLSEKDNRAAAEPERAAAMHEALKAWRASVKAPLPTPQTPRQTNRKLSKGDD